jgi:hypothetical protein
MEIPLTFLVLLPPNMALDWELDSVDDEGPFVAILDAGKLRLRTRRPKVGVRF